MEQRLLDVGATPFEQSLLEAGKLDAMPDRSRHAIFAGLGLPPLLPLANDLASGAERVAPDTPAAGGDQGVLGDQLGAGNGLPPGSDGLSQLGAGKSIFAGKSLAALVGAGAVGVAAVWAGYRTSPEPAPQQPTGEFAPLEVPELPAVEETTAGDAHEAAAQDNAEAEPKEPINTTKRPRSSAARRGDTLSQELVEIEAARSALRRGDASGALSRLQSYRREFPKGRLRAEATMLRIEALAASGDKAGATKLGKAVLARSPNGPYSRRIRSLIEE
jgi:hypothetical protein